METNFALRPGRDFLFGADRKFVFLGSGNTILQNQHRRTDVVIYYLLFQLQMWIISF